MSDKKPVFIAFSHSFPSGETLVGRVDQDDVSLFTNDDSDEAILQLEVMMAKLHLDKCRAQLRQYRFAKAYVREWEL